MIAFLPSRTVAIDLFGFAIHWYGLLYLASFVIAWFLLPKLQKYRNLSLSPDEWSSILSAAVLGVILGGRLGFVLFYEPAYYLAHPLEIFAVWHGGMSSHGGIIGVTIALLIALRKRSLSEKLNIGDIAIIPIAIGLMLGRLGNFVNQELYGVATTLPWGMAFPGAEGIRHPTQLYAVVKDFLIAVLCLWHLRKVRTRPGETVALFLILYGILRTIVELFREQEYTGLHLIGWDITRGQLLTIPVFIAGLILLWVIRKKKAS